jgi:hypothetical protein
VEWRFQKWYFVVLDKAGDAVFWVRRVRSGSGELWRWNVRPDLAACARDLNVDVEVDPEHAAPPCPR